MPDKKSSENRRKLLKGIAAGSGAVIAGKSLPENWAKPVVDVVMLPLHAQTSPPSRTLIATIDIDATDPNNTVSQPLPAGTFEIIPVSGTYVAWNAWSSVSGCDSNGENCSNGFIYSYSYNSPSLSAQSFNLGTRRYETDVQALAAAQAEPTESFTLALAETVDFLINDSAYTDNSGGVSLEIYQIT